MEAAESFSANAPAGERQTALRRVAAGVGVAAFVIYVLMLFVLALDQHFKWGMFPTAADREISALVAQLGDPNQSSADRIVVMNKIVDWNSFAVPVLINTITRAPIAQRDAAVQCLQQISLKFYGKDIADLGVDTVKLNQWWTDQQAAWDKAATAAASSSN